MSGMSPNAIISTIVRPHEDTEKIILSIKKIFPSWEPDNRPKNTSFPVQRSGIEISGVIEDFENFFTKIRESRILDTALDAMSMNLAEDESRFALSRQSAIVGKVSFVFGEDSLGGTMEVLLKGKDLDIWLEQQTWHGGRNAIPRSIGDDLAMTSEGLASEWFDSRERGPN